MHADDLRPTRRSAILGLAATLVPSPGAAQALAADMHARAASRSDLPPPDGRYVLPDGRIRIVGTDIMRSLVTRLNDRFARDRPGFSFELQLAPGLMGIGPAAYGVTPFAPMPRLLTRVERDAFRAIAGRDPVIVRAAHGSVVARDRTAVLAIYVHRENPIAHLSLDEIARIFSTGQPGGDVRSWGQLGLTGAWADRAIHAVGTPQDTGFGSYMVEEKMGGFPLTPGMTIRSVSTEVIGIVGQDIGAIGYAAINFGNGAVRQVPVGDLPSGPWQLGTAQEVMAGTYPLDRFVYFYALPQPDGRLEPWITDFFRLLLSAEGQLLVTQDVDSFLPLNAGELAVERARLAGV